MFDLAEMVSAWVHGWAISRGTSMPVAIADGLRVDLGPSGQPARFVLHTFDRQRVAALGRELTLPGTEIKTLGDSAALRSALPNGWSMYDPCDLMTAAFSHGVAEVEVPYVARIVEDGATLVGLVLDSNGNLASSARLAPSGRYGVIDKVWTEPAHQRRGLGTLLVTKLGNRALDSGLTTGLLSATADGRALYSALGWTVVDELAGAFRASRSPDLQWT
jgi:GNAT superfamily N-acetyltransferase